MMKMSTRARYGLRAAVELAMRRAWRGAGTPPVCLRAVAKAQGIPEPFLRQIFLGLKRARIAEATMGQQGGYRLTRDPSRISAYDVVEALGERIIPVPCVRRSDLCCRERRCPTRDLWCRVAAVLKRALSGSTLSQMAEHCPGQGRLQARMRLLNL
jgi:Rrf2 family protein